MSDDEGEGGTHCWGHFNEILCVSANLLCRTCIFSGDVQVWPYVCVSLRDIFSQMNSWANKCLPLLLICFVPASCLSDALLLWTNHSLSFHATSLLLEGRYDLKIWSILNLFLKMYFMYVCVCAYNAACIYALCVYVCVCAMLCVYMLHVCSCVFVHVGSCKGLKTGWDSWKLDSDLGESKAEGSNMSWKVTAEA